MKIVEGQDVWQEKEQFNTYFPQEMNGKQYLEITFISRVKTVKEDYC